MSSSIFDLKTDVSQLSSTNEGVSRMEYNQVPPTRDITTENFANGSIHFRWETSGQRWWVPGRSYIRTRFKLTDNAGAPVDLADGIAPNMGLMSSLFQNGEFRINDKPVSRVSDYMPQVDALETRLSKSKSWLESVGDSSNWWAPDQSRRMNDVSSDGVILAGNTPQVSVARNALGGGFTGATTVSLTANTGVITFGVAGDATQVFEVGDYFQFTGNGGGTVAAGVFNVKLLIIEVTNANQIIVEAGAVANIALAVNDFARVRYLAPPARKVGEFELVWVPPMSIFKVAHALPSGRYELVLNPQTATSFQKRAIESILGLASKNPIVAGGAGDFKLSVVNMYFYYSAVEGPRSDDLTYLLDLEQTRCQVDKINNDSLEQKNFDVSPSTYALTVAYQDVRAGEHTSISCSKFRFYENAANPSTPQELSMNRMFVSFAGRQLPAPDADPSFDAGNDYTEQRYIETQINSGAYFDTGGAESIQDFHERGSYYYFSWPRDGTDRSTRVVVNQSFTGADVANGRVLLFDHSKQVARIRVQGGRTVQVDLEDA